MMIISYFGLQLVNSSVYLHAYSSSIVVVLFNQSLVEKQLFITDERVP